MKIRAKLLTAAALLSVAVAAPAWADFSNLKPVAPQDVNRFVGTEVHGAAYADLGVVSQVDPNLGLIGLSGKHGEFAVLHTSLLRRDGLQMFAPTLNVGNIADISLDHWASTDLVAIAKPTITIEEQPYIEEPVNQLPPQ